MRTLFIAACFAIIAGAAVYAKTPAPVTINSCGPRINNNSQPAIPGIGIPIASSSNGIQIEFTNESSKTATVVNFSVNSNNQQFVIRDVGTFSPGVSIRHNFRNGAGQAFVLPAFIAPNVKCKVQSVRFADGTTWEKGTSAHHKTIARTTVDSAGPLSASPARVALDSNTESQLFLVSSTQPASAFRETDNCHGVASVFVAATAESSATYSVKPTAPGSCTATITDEAGNTIDVPITVSSPSGSL